MRMMLILFLFVLIPSPAMGYMPSPAELLQKMGVSLRAAGPVDISISMEYGDGAVSEAVSVRFPAQGDAPEPFTEHLKVRPNLTFRSLTLREDRLNVMLPSLYREGATTALVRLESTVCYLLEGNGARLWLRKIDLLPIQAELTESTDGTLVFRYLEPVSIADGLLYPQRTEVLRDGSVVYTEHLHPPSPSETVP